MTDGLEWELVLTTLLGSLFFVLSMTPSAKRSTGMSKGTER